jgi:hypothetical protein
VPVEDLAPPPEPSLFDQWLAARVRLDADGAVFTPLGTAFADYQAWLDQAGHAEAYPISPYAFERELVRRGLHPIRQLWRAPFETHARPRKVLRFALRSAAPATGGMERSDISPVAPSAERRTK